MGEFNEVKSLTKADIFHMTAGVFAYTWSCRSGEAYTFFMITNTGSNTGATHLIVLYHKIKLSSNNSRLSVLTI